VGLKPWLWLPPQLAHRFAPSGVRLLSRPIRTKNRVSWRSFSWQGIHFENPLGIAGSVDKNGDQIMAWSRLGAGFVEVGTVTPKPQPPNPSVILDRDLKSQSLWNRMGFPNSGTESVKRRLESLDPQVRPPLFLNVGKNRDTDNSQAAQDYAHVINSFDGLVDVFVINISSPNTAGLRDLFKPMNFEGFLSRIFANITTSIPVLLKLSPDMDDSEIITTIEVALKQGIKGFVLTNTMANKGTYQTHDGGGVSGGPLAERSKKVLGLAKARLDELRSEALLVSVGGVLTPHDVFERLELGAHLVQTYTALVYSGPLFFRKVAQEALCR